MTTRYRISGSFLLRSPLHVGDGASDKWKLDDGGRRSGSPDGIEVRTVCVGKKIDGTGTAPYIPGSSLKGALRGWCQQFHSDRAVVDSLFGTQKAGGKAIFEAATLTTAAIPPTSTWQWWDSERSTCVSANVTLDPRTRTAQDRKLRHAEYVPEGSVFTVTFFLLDPTEEELDLLLYLLNNCNESSPLALRFGAGAPDGWGSVKWTLQKIEKCGAAEVAEWISKAQTSAVAGQPIVSARQGAWSKTDSIAINKRALSRFQPVAAPETVKLEITLQLQGGFLVNDPSQRRKGGEGAILHSPLRLRSQRAYLPASSFRGAFRSQARCIWRTLQQVHPNDAVTDRPLREAKYAADQEDLFGFYQLFGAPGWASPLAISDFIPVDTKTGDLATKQEFIAIDRFTGAGAESRKFNAFREVGQELRGSVTVNLEALRSAKCGPWVFALLLFTLRDLVEGDITFGWGASKGYGAAVANVSAMPGHSLANTVADFVKLLPRSVGPAVALEASLKEWAAEFSTVVRRHADTCKNWD